MLTQVYLDLRGKGTVPSGPNCVCRGESGANFDPELFVSALLGALLGQALGPRNIYYYPVPKTLFYDVLYSWRNDGALLIHSLGGAT